MTDPRSAPRAAGRLAGLTLAVLGLLAPLVAACSATPAGPVVLHATADQAFVTPDGQPVLLNGLNVAPVWDGGAGTWDQKVYDGMAAKGFNSVRMVLHWPDFEPRRGEFDQKALATLDKAIARAKVAGLYVVLDMVHLYADDGVPRWAVTGDSVTTVSANARGYLTMLAQRYRGEAAVAAYDLVNEPARWPMDQNGVLQMYDGLIAAVREVDPHKIVMVEPSFGDTSVAAGCADLGILRHRDNLVFSVHLYYTGGDDDGFEVDCAQAGSYGHDGTTGYGAADPAALRQHLRSTLDVLARAGVPLVIGEFGLADVPGRDAWIAEMRQLFDEARLSRMWWEYRTTGGDRFSATDRDGNWRPFVDALVAPPTVAGAPTATPPYSEPAPPPKPVPTSIQRFPKAPGGPTVLAAGDFTDCNGPASCAKSPSARVRDIMGERDPNAILAIGDFQYDDINGIRTGFDLLFGPKPDGMWRKMYPAGGPTHDVDGCADPRYQAYWGRDPLAGYSFDVGDWHLVSMPSAVFRYGCAPKAVTSWLAQDLQANTKRCTLAFWQDPYWTRPTKRHDRESAVRPWIDELYAGGADVVVQASNHNYQRFAPQNPEDQPDQVRGIRAFVVGTGGAGLYAFTGGAPNVEVSRDDTWGALELTLRPDGYDWRFVPVPGQDFTDSGSGACH